MHLFAAAVTKIFNPVFTAFVTAILAISVQQISVSAKVLLAIVTFFVAALPAAVLYYQYKKGKVSSLWSPKGAERRNAYIAWVLLASVASLAAFYFEAPRLIVALGLVFLALGVVNLLLASTFKISVHMELVTVMVITAILAVSVELFYLVLLLPLVAWSRFYLKAHDITEITIGTFLTITIIYFIFSFFGLATF
ncbi:MAG: hypothetical protein WD187_03135 [Candidatus Woykebacteria bacterium]